MNNVEEFYQKEQLLKLIVRRSNRKNSFFFRIHTETRAVKIVLEDDLVNASEGKEQTRVLEIIQAGLNETEKRHEIEEHLIKVLEKDLEISKEQVRKDFGVGIIPEISDPRD